MAKALQPRQSGTANVSPKQIEIQFSEARGCRTLYVDGAFGGITPTGQVNMSVFAERVALPASVVHEVDGKGKLGNELPELRKGFGVITREIQAHLVMPLRTAIMLREWLNDKIESAEQLGLLKKLDTKVDEPNDNSAKK